MVNPRLIVLLALAMLIVFSLVGLGLPSLGMSDGYN